MLGRCLELFDLLFKAIFLLKQATFNIMQLCKTISTVGRDKPLFPWAAKVRLVPLKVPNCHSLQHRPIKRETACKIIETSLARDGGWFE
jgi:hypothetical protein